MTEITKFRNSKKEVTVGNFTININETCEITLNERPVLDPVTYDCVRGTYDGELMAKSVASLTKTQPHHPLLVFNHLAECELRANLKVTFSIYHECEDKEFQEAYLTIFENTKAEMLAKGFRYDAEKNEFVFESES